MINMSFELEGGDTMGDAVVEAVYADVVVVAAAGNGGGAVVEPARYPAKPVATGQAGPPDAALPIEKVAGTGRGYSRQSSCFCS
jgi:subtilisin family serine protease